MASASLEPPSRNLFHAGIQVSLTAFLASPLTALSSLTAEDTIPIEGRVRWAPTPLWINRIRDSVLYIRQRCLGFRDTSYYTRDVPERRDDNHLTEYGSARRGHRETRVVPICTTTYPKGALASTLLNRTIHSLPHHDTGIVAHHHFPLPAHLLKNLDLDSSPCLHDQNLRTHYLAQQLTSSSTGPRHNKRRFAKRSHSTTRSLRASADGYDHSWFAALSRPHCGQGVAMCRRVLDCRIPCSHYRYQPRPSDRGGTSHDRSHHVLRGPPWRTSAPCRDIGRR